MMIDRYVNGKLLRVLPKVKLPSVFVAPAGDAEDEGAPPAERVRTPHLPLTARVGNFDEVELCISEADACGEAHRCMRCDLEFTQPV